MGTRPLRIADLGCGTGANLRHLAPRLRTAQSWRLIDNDPALLAIAESEAKSISARYPGIWPAVLPADLNTADLGTVTAGADLVTAAALFDLVSPAWCARLIAACGRPGAALLAPLIYNGTVHIDPEDPDDRDILELFNEHQLSDKGFGPALGPGACVALARLLAESGARLTVQESDWFLGPADAALQVQLLNGIADAATVMAPERAEEIEAWRSRRIAAVAVGRPFISVGHQDVLALWPPDLNHR